jgi:hypothetical protein
VDYIKEQVGLDGKIDKRLEIPKAVKNVSASGEGFVIFEMDGKRSGARCGALSQQRWRSFFRSKLR